MSQPKSKSAELKSKLSKAVIQTITNNGGSASRKDIIAKLENSQIFDSWENELLQSNKKRWQSVFDIHGTQLANAGLIDKKNGIWSITNKGIEAANKEDFSLVTIVDEDLDDPVWMQVFRGQLNPKDNDAKAQEAKMLRNAFLRYEKNKALESIDTKKYFNEFVDKLTSIKQSEANQNRSKKEPSWLALIKMMLALILGLIVGMMMPMQIATRGSENPFIRFELPRFIEGEFDTEIAIKDKNKLLKSQQITLSAISEGLSVTTEKKGDAIHLTIKGFKVDDAKQISIKAILGIPNQTSGNILVKISGE